MMKPLAPESLSPLARLRPTEADLTADWTESRKGVAWSRIESGIELDRTAETAGSVITLTHEAIGPAAHATRTSARKLPRRRTIIAMAGVAATVAALLAVPLLLPSGTPAGPPTAQALEALAVAAAAEKPLQPGQFRHAVEESTQNGHLVTRESWTAADGKLWRIDKAQGTETYYAFPAGGDDINNPSPAFLATLPTDPAALEKYLREHVHGSSSTDEAVFVAVGDMLRGGFAPPQLRAAALRVLERTPHVSAHAGTDSRGRTATVVEFVDESIRPGEVQSIYFDPATAALLQEGLTVGSHSYSNVVTSSEVTSAVPATVLRLATDRGACFNSAEEPQDEMVCVMAITAGGETTAAEAAPSSVGAVPATAEAAPSTAEPASATAGAVPSSSGAAPATAGAVPSSSGAAPATAAPVEGSRYGG